MKKFLISLLLSLFFFNSFSQVNYTFTTATGTYNSVVGGINPTLQATVSSGNLDEGYANIASIGFPFTYNGTVYNTVGICTNGFLYLGSSGLSFSSTLLYNNNLISGLSTTQRPIIAPFWDDLILTSNTGISYNTTGTSPNRVFTIEWKNVHWGSDLTSSTLTPSISFQVSLYETTNIIEFMYQQEAGTPYDENGNLGASIGITASNTGNGNFMSLNNSSNSPTVSTSVNTTDILSKPATGQIYRFTPLVACSGMPTGGTASSSVTTSCSGTNFNLSLTGYTSANNITFQWYSSPAGMLTWSPITGANSFNYTTSQTVAKDYKCLVSCTSSSLAAYSSTVTVALTPSGSCTLVNDECTGAVSLTQTAYNATCATGTFNTSLATQSSNPTSFVNSQDDDIWFSFVATNNKTIFRLTNVSAVSGNLGNMAFALSTGTSCSSLTEITTSLVNMSNGTGEVLLTNLTVGTTYFVRLVTSGNTWRAQGNICILEPQISVGTVNSCLPLSSPTIDASNNNLWVAITDGTKIVAEINAKGNNLGTITANLYVSSTVRQFSNGRYYLNRNIQITPTTQPTSAVLVRLYLLNTELNALINQTGSQVTSLADLNVTKNTDACTATYSGGGTLLTPTSRTTYGDGAFLELSTSSFSSFYMHGAPYVLPSTILDFKGEKNGTFNILQWHTTNEQNAQQYIIEKSLDGNSFKEIGSVTAKNSLTTNVYSFKDEQNVAIHSYYRLKQLDVDGKFTYSSTVFIKGLVKKSFGIIAVYPNPVTHKTTITVSSNTTDVATIHITDVTGKLISTTTISLIEGQNNISINTSSLKTGNYLIRLVNSLGQTTSAQKIIKL